MRDSLIQMDASKVAGYDGTHPAIVKPQAEYLVKPCTQLFNASLDKGRYPADWLTSTVKPMHKVGDRDNCNIYRPVILTSTMMKNLERVLPHRIDRHLEAKKLRMI